MTVLVAGCDLPRAHGDAHAVIVGADSGFWHEVEDVFLDAMAPTIQTVREERPFRVTHQDPTEMEYWNNLRRFRQVLVVGESTDPWVSEALERYQGEDVGSPPALLQVRNVWARGQQVSILLLPETGQAEAVEQLASALHEVMSQQYREYVRNRMYVSGRNAELTESLAAEEGFSFEFPNVYRVAARGDSIFRFRNDNPSPRELIREIGLTWITPVPEEDLTRGELEQWRLEFANEHYNDPQELDLRVVTYRGIEVDGIQGVELQSAWVAPEDAWPAGGPFITRALRCPDQDRLYLMDAWVYAPDRDKYEYVLQLENILASFRCH